MTEQIKTNNPIWIDLSSAAPGEAKSFYGRLFGWEVEELGPEAGGYAFFNLNGQMVAGVGPTQSPEQPSAWLPYIATDDVEATLEAVKENGGDVTFGAMDVMETGRMGILRDPGGAVLGLWQPKTMSGFRVQDQPGAFTWMELTSRDPESAKRFYTSLFGWGAKTSEGDMPYTEWQVDGRSIGGMTQPGPQVPEGAPDHWVVYFASDDVDATASKASEIGGQVLVGPMDYPGGRFAIIQDPQGGVPFGVVKSQTGS
ncbi:MAG TPA: VOC family protein [Actinomycetota bacterium]